MRRSFSSLVFALALVTVPPARGEPPRVATKATALAPLTASPALTVDKVTLPNGLEVIYDVDKRTPIVTVNLWYHVGSKDEPPHRNGFAHLFEHVMFQGSKHVPEDTYFRFLEKAGATSINGTTNTDRTNYFETLPKNQLELALWLESDRMAFLLNHVDQKTFESQREVVKNERRQSYENAPYGLVGQFIREELFAPEHPYHLLTIGSADDLNAATLEDVRAFFRRFYVPNNATLVLSGDFDRDQAATLVTKYFGPILRGSDVPRARPITATLEAPKVIAVEANVELSRVYVDWHSPALFAEGDAELDLIANILSTGKTSRLYKRLVYDLQIAQSVTANQASMELGSLFEITATAKAGHSPEELLKVIDEELALLRRGGVRDDELDRAKTSVITEAVFGIEHSAARANRLNSYNHYLGNPSWLSRDVERTRRATNEMVMNAARATLDAQRRVTTLVRASASAPVAGRKLRVSSTIEGAWVSAGADR